MSIFKCKMCGGTLEFEKGATIGICDSCGTKQTLPFLDTEKKEQLFERANHYRSINEFDKAAVIYEGIISDDPEEPEGYWGMCLCKYGIEYVKDPKTQTRVPTVNRAQYISIFDDDNYKKTIELADLQRKEIYEAEAKAIDELQKDILALSQKEEPFDVFICYKETDENGRRTEDSVIAHDLYKQLTNEKYKVFYSRITLEDKLGTAFEPYIFAALNSAKVMLVVGTKKEYLNAVWVKNEWSRYLALINGGAKKTLIPIYKDIDPYDLPEEFARLQAQDLSNLGSTQDIVRAVEKLVGNESENKANIEANSALKGMLENSYKKACAEMQKAITFVAYNKAAESFEIIMDYKDSANLYQECVDKSKALKEKMKKTLKIVKKISAIAAIVIAITTALIFTWTPYVSPALKSAYGKTMLFFGNYSEYYKTLIELDSVDTIDADDIKDCLSEMAAGSEIGDTIIFGTINEQPCVWRVLDKKEDRILVISENCIGTARQYFTYENAAWEYSAVRARLNGDHFGSLEFTSVEESFILLSIVEATDNPKYSTQQGSSTEDKLFLLSTEEAEKYFDSDESRICYPITVNGISDISCSWGLRTVGSLIKNNAVVDSSGGIDYEGNSMTSAVNIRPAMWLSLDS